MLANIYLHYVLDLWADWWRRHVAHGDVIIVRFADDFVMGFEEYQDACRFLHDLRERFAKFGLELHPGKTRLIEFGRFAAANRQKRGAGKPETFDFLGFTHICAKMRDGRFWVRRITVSKRMRAKLAEVRDQLRQRRHQPVPEQGRWLGSVVRGHWRRPCRARQPQGGGGVPHPGDAALAGGAAAPQPALPPGLEAHEPPGHPVAAACPRDASLPRRALWRSYPRQGPGKVVHAV